METTLADVENTALAMSNLRFHVLFMSDIIGHWHQ